MGDDWNGRDDTPRPDGRPGINGFGGAGGYDDLHDELERQARETMRVILDSAGDLGTRVRQVMDRASSLWEESGTPPDMDEPGDPHEQEERARALARRWVKIDFLVDPELPDRMRVTSLHDSGVWRVELRERGESRWQSEATEPYRGQQPEAPGPVLPVWDYDFATVPEIESGERRERIEHTEMTAACRVCNGSGHRPCAACEGRGFVQCPVCHGRSRIPCKRCHGRARIPDPAAERRARADKSYFQVHAERFASDATLRVADFAERLRQEYGVPLPPSAQWAPIAPASGETLPCPDCTDGTVACTCGTGKLVCEVCDGSTFATCAACEGTGRVLRSREITRRFDTRIYDRVLPAEDPEIARWLDESMLRRVASDDMWEGNADQLPETAPAGVPVAVWSVAHELAASALPAEPSAGESERRVLSRRVRVMRVPLTRVEYTFGGRPFVFTAAGAPGTERFLAQDFPPRWSRVSRFFRALVRDLNGDLNEETPEKRGEIRAIEDYRARRLRNTPQPVRIVIEDTTEPQPPTTPDKGQTYPGTMPPEHTDVE